MLGGKASACKREAKTSSQREESFILKTRRNGLLLKPTDSHQILCFFGRP